MPSPLYIIMEELTLKYIPKSEPCDHPWQTSQVIVFGVFVEIGLLLGVINGNSILIRLVCFILMFAPIIIILKMIRQVNFKTNIIEVKPLLGKAKKIEYSKLKKFYRHNLGEHSIELWIIEYQSKRKTKKITFYDDELNFDEFKTVLLNLKGKYA